MKKILQYGRHLLKAKGRHGTHSPFVYAFVEQVMRGKGRFAVKGSGETLNFSPKEINMLGRTIRFLEPGRIIADAEWIPLLNAIVSLLPEHIPIAAFTERGAVKQDSGGKTLFIHSHKSQVDMIKALIAQDDIFVLSVRPHASAISAQAWFQLSAMPGVKMRLDYWYFGLLVNDPAFKGSQYFRLR